MMSSKVDKVGRRVADRGNTALSTDVVKLLKTQDATYIRMLLQMARKEREELEQKILVEDGEIKALGKQGKRAGHLAFVGDREEQRRFKKDEWFGEGGEMPSRNKKREVVVEEDEDEDEDMEEDEQPKKKLSKKQQEAQLLAEKERKTLLKQRVRNQERMAIHLAAVKEREKQLVIAEEELEKQRAKMNNTIGGINKNGVKFKVRERKS